MATLPRDLQEFLSLLTTRKIEFFVIGGVAFNAHAPPRSTKDLEVWVRPTVDNIERQWNCTTLNG